MEYNEIEKLKQQLVEAELNVKWNKLQNDLLKTKERYLNKYYGSHNFNYSRLKYYKNNNLSLLSINKIYIGELYGDSIIETFEQFKSFYDKDRLYVICEGEHKNITKHSETVSITVGKSRDVAHRLIGFNKEIDKNTYDSIDTMFKESIELVFNTPIKNVPKFNYLDGDQVKLLEKYGEKFITVTPEQLNSLDWHPFLYTGNKLLVNDLSKQLIIDKIKEEQHNDSLDVDTYFAGERIRRIGNRARIVNNLTSVLNELNKIK